MQRQVRHLPAGDPRRALDEVRVVVLADDQLRERDAVLEPERVHGRDRRLLRFCEWIGEEPRGIDVDPADAEADPRRPQSIRKRQRRHLATARDREPVQLDPFVVALDDRLFGRRLGQRRMQVGFEVVDRFEHEDAALAARVRRLQHRREPHRF